MRRAIDYLNAISKKEGLEPCYAIQGEKVVWTQGLECTGYRLPTEAEWEYAARGGTDTAIRRDWRHRLVLRQQRREASPGRQEGRECPWPPRHARKPVGVDVGRRGLQVHALRRGDERPHHRRPGAGRGRSEPHPARWQLQGAPAHRPCGASVPVPGGLG
ncbi:SUMF1/EgtB/PvdO family nonheme iron enzyme [Corallococcus exiguus]|nr:SUMF1/EgtB/PvdO family nonheme iron enzyme [Corallococcus exiguus]